MSNNLVAKRDSLKASLVKYMKWANTINNQTTHEELTGYLGKLDSRWTEIESVQADINEVSGPSELPFQKIESAQCEEIYKMARNIIATAIKNINWSEETDPPFGRSSTDGTNPKPDPPNTYLSIIARNNWKVSIAEQGLLRVEEYANQANVENTTLILARGHLGLLEQHWRSYMEASHLETNSSTTARVHLDIAQKEILYINTKAAIEELITRFATTTVRANNPATNTDVKLPCIELPKFHGNYESWTSFFDLFTSLVDNNRILTGSQKLHYLKSSVEGEAAQLIRSYNITDANYVEAWRALQARYQNKRLIVNSHLKHIMDLQKLKVESASGLRKAIDSFSESIRALTALGRPSDQWDDLLVYIFVEYMDSETRRYWELSLADEMPTFAQLRAFVEKRCRSLEAAGATYKSQSHSRPIASSSSTSTQYKPRALVGTSEQSVAPTCPMCKTGSHFVFACPQFHRLNVGLRYREAQNLGICFNCLRTGHFTSNCTARPCKTCQARHHTLLHYMDKPSSGQNHSSGHNHSFGNNHASGHNQSSGHNSPGHNNSSGHNNSPGHSNSPGHNNSSGRNSSSGSIPSSNLGGNS